MPITARTAIKASVVYLCLGAIIGALLLVNRWVLLGPAVSALRDSHISMLVVGWLTQLIVGVAWWLLPPLSLGARTDGARPRRRGQAQRGNEPLFWVTLLCLNAGVLMRAASSPLFLWTQTPAFTSMADLSDLLLLVAAVTVVLNLWGRVRAPGRRA